MNIETKETWKPVVGYEAIYSVSSLGRVRRDCERTGGGPKFAGTILKCKTALPNYLMVGLRKTGGPSKQFTVHALVAAAFIGPRPPGLVINHKDGIKHNNASGNLEYITLSENHRHSIQLGLEHKHSGFRQKNTVLNIEVARAARFLRESGWSWWRITSALRISPAKLSLILKGEMWADNNPHNHNIGEEELELIA